MAVVPLGKTLVLGVVVLAGCGRAAGPPTYPVSGRVTYQGAPLERGTVLFVPETGPAAGATIAADGTFSLRAVAGKHQVGVSSVPEPPPGIEPMTYDAPPLIPPRYSRPHSSGLTAEVQAGRDNRVTFELE